MEDDQQLFRENSSHIHTIPISLSRFIENRLKERYDFDISIFLLNDKSKRVNVI